ncbi:MAG TPA: glycosyltransferase [Bryobacteraceae bacterium]|nr:glycosyltransferase [Bryobacteraceae bacterium]
MPPCRILFVAPPVGPIGSGEAGGVETHLLHLAPILVARGHHIGILAPAGSRVPAPGVVVHQVDGQPSPSATRAARTAAAVVHTNGVLENLWDRALRLQRDYDVVVGVNYDWLAFYLTPFFATTVGHWITICSAIDEVDRIIERRWGEGRLHLAMYTGAQVGTFPFLERRRVHLLYGAVDAAVFRYGAEPRDRLCWAGRISPEKGLEDAIAVAAALRMPLDVCGKIQDESYWESVTRASGSPEIVYHGFLSPAELQQRYANARATLVTPRWIEAFGNIVVESLACGTPVVAYNRGGPAEIVAHGKSGILVPQDDVPALIDGVRQAVALDRRAVRARAEEFSFDRMADRLQAWIESIRGAPRER